MKVWSKEHQRWYYSWARVYWKRACLFFGLLWRDTGLGYRLGIRISWELASGMWSERDTHYRFTARQP